MKQNGWREAQAERAASRSLAWALQAVAVSGGTLIVARDGHLFINTTGNPGLAAAMKQRGYNIIADFSQSRSAGMPSSL